MASDDLDLDLDQVGGEDWHLDALDDRAPFDPADCGGVWTGFDVVSDADPGL
jgi:hypothetical protein